MMKSYLILLTLCLAVCSLFGQERLVKGRVIDAETKQPIRGASVFLNKSDKASAITDENGNFQLKSLSEKDVLVIRFLGYKEVTTMVSNQDVMSIALESNRINLEESVVIGYATVKRRDLTGAVSSVSEKQLKDIPIASAAEALTGRLAGVQVSMAEGAPGANANIKVRGGGSITQDNSPLYIIDGIQMENGLNNISPQEIESVDVLKDASATAIYGARGANGVVLVTTKSGKAAKTTVAYNGMGGVSFLNRKMGVMDPYNFVLYQYERSRGSQNEEQMFGDLYGTFADIESYREKEVIDWQDEMMGNTGQQTVQNVNITGGTRNTDFYINYEFRKDDAIVTNSAFTRHQVNVKINHTVSNFFKFGTSIRHSDQVIDGAGISSDGTSSLNALRNMIKYRPFSMPGFPDDVFDPIYTEQTNGGNNLGLINPNALFNGQYREYKQSNSIFSGYAILTLTDYLSFRSTLGVDLGKTRQNAFDDYMTPNAFWNYDAMPYVAIMDADINTLNWSNTLTYSNRSSKSAFKKNNDIDILLGHEIFSYHREAIDSRFRNFPVGIDAKSALQQLRMGTSVVGFPTNAYGENNLLSFFTRVNYTFKKKYLLTATYRADGSSKFASGNNWAYFPSGSLAWRVSDENFMKPVSVISDFKVRVGYGQSGNNRIGDYLYQTFFNPDIYGLNNDPNSGALVPSTLGNTGLKWETTTSKNLGVDLAFAANRFQLTVDLYQNDTKDLLLQSPISFTSGYNVQIQNTGATRNQGLEVQLQASILDRDRFSWSANFNMSFNRNKVRQLASGQESYLVNSGWGITGQPADYIVKVGETVGAIFGYESDGFYTLDDFDYTPDPAVPGWGTYTLKEGLADPSNVIGPPQPGMMKFNAGDDGVLDESDKKILGFAAPKFFGGLNQSFTYRNFDASIFLNFQYGNKVLNANKIEFTNGYSNNSNLLKEMENRWSVINDQGELIQRIVQVSGRSVAQGVEPTVLAAINQDAEIWIPNRATSGFFPTSWAVEDASFLRINNITLGYTFPAAGFLKRLKASSFRLYATANNLAIFTNYSGYDPEVDTRRQTRVTPGVDYSAYPRNRTFLFGANLSF